MINYPILTLHYNYTLSYLICDPYDLLYNLYIIVIITHNYPYLNILF